MVSSVAVLSDIHGMLPALDRVLAERTVQEAEIIVVTGDHTWGPQPREVLDRLAGLGDRAILLRGNADRELMLMAQGIDVGMGDDPLSVWGSAALSAVHQEMLRAMPEQVTLEVAGFGAVLFCHATPRNDEEVVLVDSRLERWAEVYEGVAEDVETIVCGHTHMPFVRVAGGRLVINPGSVGLPYGRRGAHWAVLRDGAVTLTRTLIDPDWLVQEVSAASDYPDAGSWLDDAVRRPASDAEVLEVFGPRDGRQP